MYFMKTLPGELCTELVLPVVVREAGSDREAQERFS